MKSVVNVKYNDNMSFEADIDGHKIIVDASKENGGNDEGPRPKPLMLVALAGCTGMDVVSILKKMKVEYESLNIRVEGVTTDEHPKKYIEMKVVFEFKGKNLPLSSIEKAVKLSEDKYCGVNAFYKEVIKVNYEIVIKE